MIELKYHVNAFEKQKIKYLVDCGKFFMMVHELAQYHSSFTIDSNAIPILHHFFGNFELEFNSNLNN